MEIKEKTKYALIVFMGMSTFGYWAFAYPEMLMERESLQLFLLNGDYLAERLAVPGGFARYVGEFLVQFFMNEKVGACLLAVLFMAIQWLSWLLLRRCVPSAKEKVLYAVSFLPVVAIWFLLRDIDISMTLPVSISLTLLMMYALPARRNLSLIVSLGIVPIGYWLVGPVIVLVAVYHLRWLHKPFQKVKITVESMMLASLLAICLLASSCFVPYSLENILKGIDYQQIQVDKIGTQEVIEYDYLQRQKAWDKVLYKATRQEPKAKACVHIVNLARFYQKEITPEELKVSLYKPFTALTSTVSAMMMSDLFFQMGYVNFAQRCMFEAMESTSNYNKSGRALCRLAETALVTGQYEVALKYVSLLEETLFYRKWAQVMKSLVLHPEQIKAHPMYGPLQKIYSETEDELFI